MERRVSYGEYLSAVAMTLARRHRPLWLVRRCACGAELPCRATHRVPIGRDHWPDQPDDSDDPYDGDDAPNQEEDE